MRSGDSHCICAAAVPATHRARATSAAGLCSKLCMQPGCSAACLIAPKPSREAMHAWDASTAVVYSAQHKPTLAICNETPRFTRLAKSESQLDQNSPDCRTRAKLKTAKRSLRDSLGHNAERKNRPGSPGVRTPRQTQARASSTPSTRVVLLQVFLQVRTGRERGNNNLTACPRRPRGSP